MLNVAIADDTQELLCTEIVGKHNIDSVHALFRLRIGGWCPLLNSIIPQKSYGHELAPRPRSLVIGSKLIYQPLCPMVCFLIIPLLCRELSTEFSATLRHPQWRLEELYGVRPIGKDGSIDVRGALSRRIVLHLHETQPLNTLNRKTSAFRRVRWVVRDKEKFGRLIRNLSYFIAPLNMIILDNQRDVHSPLSSLKKEIENFQNIRNLQWLLRACKDRDGDLAEATHGWMIERCTIRILDLLWFREIDERKNNVAEAHEKTPEWTLNPPSKLCLMGRPFEMVSFGY